MGDPLRRDISQTPEDPGADNLSLHRVDGQAPLVPLPQPQHWPPQRAKGARDPEREGRRPVRWLRKWETTCARPYNNRGRGKRRETERGRGRAPRTDPLETRTTYLHCQPRLSTDNYILSFSSIPLFYFSYTPFSLRERKSRA